MIIFNYCNVKQSAFVMPILPRLTNPMAQAYLFIQCVQVHAITNKALQHNVFLKKCPIHVCTKITTKIILSMLELTHVGNPNKG